MGTTYDEFDETCSSTRYDLLEKSILRTERNKILAKYGYKIEEDWQLRMKRVRNKGCFYYALDLDSTVCECLKGKTVIEFPTIDIVHKDVIINYKLIIEEC